MRLPRSARNDKQLGDHAPMKVYDAKWVGSDAQQFVKQTDAAEILGVTSKGIFLQNPSGEVVFISGEVFRGPLTINLDEMLDFKELYAVGERCRICNGQISCPRCQVDVSDAPVWEPSPIMFDRDRFSQASGGINLAKEVIKGYEDGLFFAFLDALISQPDVINEYLWEFIP